MNFKQFIRFAVQIVLMAAFSCAHADSYADFFRAVNVDDAGTVKSLLERGFDPNAADPQGQVGLFLALRDESPRVAAVFLAHPQLKADAINSNNETALMMAALRGRVDAAQHLIQRGAQVNRVGWTPLHYAASGPEPQLVSLLLERGAQVDARSPPPRHTALMMAARFAPEESVALLLAKGADPRVKNDRGDTAAMLARAAGRESLALRLEQAAR
jgi:uncharacterized protein